MTIPQSPAQPVSPPPLPPREFFPAPSDAAAAVETALRPAAPAPAGCWSDRATRTVARVLAVLAALGALFVIYAMALPVMEMQQVRGRAWTVVEVVVMVFCIAIFALPPGLIAGGYWFMKRWAWYVQFGLFLLGAVLALISNPHPLRALVPVGMLVFLLFFRRSYLAFAT